MTRSRRFVASGAALSLSMLTVACSEPLSPRLGEKSTLPAMAVVPNPVTVPFRAMFFTDLESLAPDPSCGALPILLNTQVGVGEATQIGRFTVRITFCVDAAGILDDGQLTEGESAPYASGFGTLVAANGDELYIEIEGVVLPSDHPDYDLEFHDPFTIVGGTGRFDGASGAGVTNSFVDLGVQPSRTTHDWSGTLTLIPGR